MTDMRLLKLDAQAVDALEPLALWAAYLTALVEGRKDDKVVMTLHA
jgi:hypothetical protein